MMARQLDKKLKEKNINVTVNTLHPGVVINNKMIGDAESRGFFGKKDYASLNTVTNENTRARSGHDCLSCIFGRSKEHQRSILFQSKTGKSK